jgi:hypothetical protein
LRDIVLMRSCLSDSPYFSRLSLTQHSYRNKLFHMNYVNLLPQKFYFQFLFHFGKNSTRYSTHTCRSQWPRGLRRGSATARLLRLWLRIPPGAWMSVCCECCVLSGRGLCDGLITRPEESYRLWCVDVCDQETSKTRRLKPATGLRKYNHSGL